MTQPMGNGQVMEYTWQRAVGEARRMAAYIKSLNLPPKSNIALLSKKLCTLDYVRSGYLDGGTCDRTTVSDSEC